MLTVKKIKMKEIGFYATKFISQPREKMMRTQSTFFLISYRIFASFKRLIKLCIFCLLLSMDIKNSM